MKRIKGVTGRLGAMKKNNQVNRDRIQLKASACCPIDRNHETHEKHENRY